MPTSLGIALALVVVLGGIGLTLWLAGILHKPRRYVYRQRGRRR